MRTLSDVVCHHVIQKAVNAAQSNVKFAAVSRRGRRRANFADVAQLVEHVICNLGVAGSSPVVSSIVRPLQKNF